MQPGPGMGAAHGGEADQARGLRAPPPRSPVLALPVLRAQSPLELFQGYRRLSPSRANELPEGLVGLEHDGIPALAFDTEEHRCRLPVASDDDPIFLSLIEALLDSLLEVAHCHRLHKISPVVRPRGFFLTARTYTTRSSAATS